MLLEPQDEIEHHPGLGHAEGGGRLVEHDQLRVPHHGLGDGHGLALAPGEGGDGLADRSDRGHVEAREGLRRCALHAVLVEQGAAQAFAAEEHVLDDVQVVREGQVLVDRLDPERRRILRAGDVDLASLPEDLALVHRVDARDALGQHRLPGAVVAAEGSDLSVGDVEVDTVQGLDRAEMLADAAQPQQRLRDARSDGGR